MRTHDVLFSVCCCWLKAAHAEWSCRGLDRVLTLSSTVLFGTYFKPTLKDPCCKHLQKLPYTHVHPCDFWGLWHGPQLLCGCFDTLGGPSCGCPYNKSHTIVRPVIRPLIFGNSYVRAGALALPAWALLFEACSIPIITHPKAQS